MLRLLRFLDHNLLSVATCSRFLCTVNHQRNTRELSENANNMVGNYGPSPQFVEKLPGDKMKFLDMIKQEYYILSCSMDLPEMTDERWEVLLNTHKRKARVRFLEFARVADENQKEKEKERENKLLRADEIQKEKDSIKEDRRKRSERGEMIYKPGFNTLFTNYDRDRMMPCWYARMALNQIVGCPQIVFDLSWLNTVIAHSRNLSLRNLEKCYQYNRSHRNPFELFFTGINLESDWWKSALQTHLNIFNYDKRLPCLESHITEQSYLDLFPKNDLIYLTADSPHIMPGFEADKIYIIGGVIEKYDSTLGGRAFTLGKGKSEGIRCERLPIDHHVDWKYGSKTLYPYNVLAILLDVYKTNNWAWAIKNNVPVRNFMTLQERKNTSREMGVNNYTKSLHEKIRLLKDYMY